MLFFLIASSIFILDQMIKVIVKNSMCVNQSIPLVDNILHLTFVQNKGAAFGILSNMGWFLIIVGVLVICGIIYFHEKIKYNDSFQIPLAFLLGGSLGNMYDRISRSYIIDYIDFRVWPVFNLADIMINVGVFLIIVRLFMEKKNAPDIV